VDVVAWLLTASGAGGVFLNEHPGSRRAKIITGMNNLAKRYILKISSSNIFMVFTEFITIYTLNKHTQEYAKRLPDVSRSDIRSRHNHMVFYYDNRVIPAKYKK